MAGCDQLDALRARTQRTALRIEDPYDSRAALYRAAALIAAARHPDTDRVAAALFAVATHEEPPKLEALLGIPARWSGSDIERRNARLRRAAVYIDVPPGRSVRVALAAEWKRFVRQLWPLWRDEFDAPVGCSYLNLLLFEATRFSRGETLSARQIGNILKTPSEIETL